MPTSGWLHFIHTLDRQCMEQVVGQCTPSWEGWLQSLRRAEHVRAGGSLLQLTARTMAEGLLQADPQQVRLPPLRAGPAVRGTAQVGQDPETLSALDTLCQTTCCWAAGELQTASPSQAGRLPPPRVLPLA